MTLTNAHHVSICQNAAIRASATRAVDDARRAVHHMDDRSGCAPTDPPARGTASLTDMAIHG